MIQKSINQMFCKFIYLFVNDLINYIYSKYFMNNNVTLLNYIKKPNYYLLQKPIQINGCSHVNIYDNYYFNDKRYCKLCWVQIYVKAFRNAGI